jgi:cell division septation protein DedD
MHPNAELAARAAVAAQRQDKFWPMHEGLFEAGAPLSRPALERIARSIGLDMNRFKADLDSEVVADAVLRDRKQGEAVELTGTPGIFVNGRRFVSGADFDADLAEWVKLELELATGGAAAPSASPPAPSKPSTSPPAPSKPSVAPAPSASAEGIAASPAAKPSPAPAKPAASAPR